MTTTLKAILVCGLVAAATSPAVPRVGAGGSSTGGGSYSERPHCDTSISDGGCVRTPGERRHHARPH